MSNTELSIADRTKINEISSLEIEKNCISAILQFPSKITELPSNIVSSDFVSEVHGIIFKVIRSIVEANLVFDRILVCERIKNLGFQPKDGLDIFDYVEGLALNPIREEAINQLYVELKKYSICREFDESAALMRNAIRRNMNEPILDISKKLDYIYNRNIDILGNGNEEDLVDIFAEMEGLILKRAQNPVEEIGHLSPFPIYNNYFGGFRPGGVYVFASRTGQGKSTLLSYIGRKIAEANKKVRILCLDSEMGSEDIMIRSLSSITGVPFWYLDTGKYRHNNEMNLKVEQALQDIRKNRIIFHHKYVANKTAQEISSIIKRWYHTKCGSENSPIVIYDYLKIGSENVSNHQKEYQIMGEKVNILKETVTSIGAPMLSAVQINRTGVVGKSNVETVDDETVISISDRISWFCNYLGIFRRKSMAEIERDGEAFGTHLLSTLKARFQGKLSMGHADWVKIEPRNSGEKPTYRPNYINYLVKDFAMEERSCLRDMNEKKIIYQNSNDEEESFFV